MRTRTPIDSPFLAIGVGVPAVACDAELAPNEIVYSAIGAFFGAIIFGLVSIGLTYTPCDSDWFQVFRGSRLLLAVLFNNFIRRRVTGER